jgi:TRAP-type C4-dicarboxylate transport system substrate-binding protein
MGAMGRGNWRVVALAALALTVVSCTASGEASPPGQAAPPEAAAPPKEGGAGEPRVLHMGTDDWPDRAAAQQVEEFARAVELLSEGGLRIEPVWRAGDGDEQWDQVVARKVIGGQLDLGNVPSRAWDTEGVVSLRALNAPFLITTDELLDAVVTSDLADGMLAGLDEVGVVGLALVPEGLRHPFGFAQPLLGLEDYHDGHVRAPHSATTQAMFEAFGASTTGANTDALAQVGMESAYALDVQGPATGNVTFFPKVGTLVVNGEVFTSLSDAHQQVLIEAAAQVRDWAIDTRPSDLEQAAGYCETGGTIVLASDTDLAALAAAAEPVNAELEADPQTKEQLEAIRILHADLDSQPITPEACGTPLAVDEGEREGDEPDAGADNSAINGVYRWEFTREELEAAGEPPEEVDNNVGVWTNWFQDGRWWDQEEPMGTYVLDGDLMTITHKDGVVATYRWEQNEQGDLLVTVVDSPPDWEAFDELWTSKPWLRVDDVD